MANEPHPPHPPRLPRATETADPGGLDLPRYAVRLPPPVTLRYALQRGAAAGTASLHWQPGLGRYALTLQAQLPGQPALAWASTGAIDAGGLAPERYAESRRGREQRAANFEPDRGRIRFSGTDAERPLPPGAQDRLSWLAQLAGVLAATPALAAPGQAIRLYVAGARGEGGVWVFRVLGAEALALAAGPRSTLRLLREPEQPYDTRAEVWLDPARAHLPVRVRWQAPPAPQATELTLQEPGADGSP
ncbi:MAG: DUF3108 domain-containing protein [Burkholderiales bacterium]|nr:DUF3108 domain-containing protein [Burkholderiales bacterium]